MRIIPPGYGEAALHWSLAGSTRGYVCTFGIVDPATATPNAVAAAISAPVTAAAGALSASYLNSSWTYTGVTVTLNRTAGLLRGNFTTNVPGTGSADVVPPNVCILYHKTTAVGGRVGRGRMYVPAGYLPEARVDNVGLINTVGWVPTTPGNVTAFLTGLATAGYEMVLLHSVAGATPDIVTELVAENIVATQRDRLQRARR